MKKTLLFFVVFATSLLTLPSLSFPAPFKVIRVYDGETIMAKGHDIVIKVRLVGIDAPEMGRDKRYSGQPYSLEAKNHLADLLLNKTVEIKGYGLDVYNQVLGLITIDGRNINLEMVLSGMARASKRRPPREFDLAPYHNAERQAKRGKRGMWTQQ